MPKIASYILGNPEDYTLSSLVGAIDGLLRFEAAGEKSRLGTLYIPRSMPIALLDGQHRRAAIDQAVREENAKKKGAPASATRRSRSSCSSTTGSRRRSRSSPT